jgi:hypothetical protein
MTTHDPRAGVIADRAKTHPVSSSIYDQVRSYSAEKTEIHVAAAFIGDQS